MANTAVQWQALIACYGQHRKPVPRSNCLLWATPQEDGSSAHLARRFAKEAGLAVGTEAAAEAALAQLSRGK